VTNGSTALVGLFTPSVGYVGMGSDLDSALAAGATLVAAAFALSTLDRWMLRRRPHDLAWTVSLGLFALASGAFWWGVAHGWTLGTFRLFYLCGAILNVPWLALGTVYLLGGVRSGNVVRGWLMVLSGLATGTVLFAPTRAAVVAGELPEGREVFGVAPRVMAAVGSGVAALVIIAGALWSAWRVVRGASPSLAGTRVVARPRRLALGNVLIATGTLLLSASGSLAGRLGEARAFAVTLLAGVVVLFAGFLVASAPVRRRLASVPDAASADGSRSSPDDRAVPLSS
jgi:hypothetical protein